MSRLSFLSIILVLFLVPFAVAETGPTYAPRAVDHAEVIDAAVAPTMGGRPAPSVAYQYPASVEDFGPYFMQYVDEFMWSVDPTVGDLTAPSLRELSAGMKAAVDAAPDWMQLRLAHRFFELPADAAEDLADLIVTPPDALYRDEIAFLVAFSSRSDLLAMEDSRALLVENVQSIYELDAILDYVEIVEIGESGKGEYGTTLRYNIIVDETPTEYELPMDVYYWNIVHPKLDVEGPDFIDPLDGRSALPAEGGHYFRNYLMFDVEGEGSYQTPMYMQGVDTDDLQDLGPSARGYLTDMSIHNLEIAYQGGTNNVVFAEFAFGTGQIFATTMRVAEAYSANDSPLLENLMNQGCGDMLLPEDTPIALVGDVLVPEFQTALEALGRWDDVTQFSAADLLALDEDGWATFKSTYGKTVIMPYQTRVFWSMCITTEDIRTPLEGYVSEAHGYKVLQMFLANDDLDDPAGQTFPGGFTTTAQATNETNDIDVYGRPLLADMLAGIDVLWDGVQVGLSGDRPLWDNANAVEAIGNWVGKNMLDNIEERGESGAGYERALQPVRIAYNHYGNCGELQDLGSAAMRAALIPGGLISTMNEDHVWSEFYFNGEWRPFQVDWTNSTNNIGNPGICYDNPDPEISKNISFVVFWYGDGRIAQVPERYTDYVTLNFAITDVNGDPVPDAVIDIYTEGSMTSSKRQGAWLITDQDGQATVNLGDWRNYFVHVTSGAGEYPPEEKGGEKIRMALVVRADDAEPGSVFDIEQQLEGTAVHYTPQDIEQKNESFALHVTLEATDRLSSPGSAFSSARPYYEMEPPLLDVFLVDEDNQEKARRNQPFEAAYAKLGIADLDERVFPPDEGNWTLMVTHHSSPISDHLLDIEITTEGDPYVPEEEPTDDDTTGDDDDTSPPPGSSGDDDDDDSGGGCGC